MNSECPVLVVDDEPQINRLISDALELSGLACRTAGSGEEARQLLRRRQFRVVITDISMPGLGGLELLGYCKRRGGCEVILMTGQGGDDCLAEALGHGAYDFFSKPFDVSQLVDSVHRIAAGRADSCSLPHRAVKALRMEDVSRRVAIESIFALAQAVEAKDPYTRRHSDHVAHYAVGLAQHMGLVNLREVIRTSALLHDIGKIGIPDTILTKPGALTEEEFQHIRRHPALGEDILSKISMFAQEATIVRYHHERWDGRGYPDGIAGKDIPLEARIVNIADSMDAMLMQRTYKFAYSVQTMLDELIAGAGTQFDPKLAQMAVQWCRQHPEQLITTHGLAAVA